MGIVPVRRVLKCTSSSYNVFPRFLSKRFPPFLCSFNLSDIASSFASNVTFAILFRYSVRSSRYSILIGFVIRAGHLDLLFVLMSSSISRPFGEYFLFVDMTIKLRLVLVSVCYSIQYSCPLNYSLRFLIMSIIVSVFCYNSPSRL